MDAPEYIYNGQPWSLCSTEVDGNNFFHAVFGLRERDDQPYQDKDAKFRRKCWEHFLRYTRQTTSRGSLLFQTVSDDNYCKYFQPHYKIALEDIPFLSALENTRVVVFTNKYNEPTVVEPDCDLLCLYPLRSKNNFKEVAIHFDGCKFLRMCSGRATSIVTDRLLQSGLQKAKYNKLSGSAGIKGGLYQVNLLTIFLLNGLNKCGSWRLSTENADAGKFDDLVFQILPTESAILLQAKHRKNTFKRITYDELFSANPDKDDFSLPKYFFSYQKIKKNFNVQNVVVCTNVDLHKDANEIVDRGRLGEDHMLHYKGERSIHYKFNRNTLPDLKRGIAKYSQNARDCEDIFSEDDMLDYLEHLQFIANYPSQSDLDQVIETILSGMEFCTRFESKDYAKYIIKKMIEWFEEEKGWYLTEVNARALFAEIRSNKFCERLHNCNIFIKNNTLPRSARILHVVSQRGYILNMIKIYVALHGEGETLFVNPREDIEVQKQIVEAFEVPHYTALVVCLARVPDDAMRHICDTLTGILKRFRYKKVILISEEKGKLAEKIKDASEGDYEEIYENITFNDLTEESQERVLEKVVQFFHAKL